MVSSVQSVNDSMSSVAVVRALAGATSRKAKAAIISDAFLSGNRDFFSGARLAFDRLVQFRLSYVAQIAPDDLNPDDPGTFSFADFIALTDQLRHRAMTAPLARTAIAAAASACHGPTWNEFYRPVLLKDLKIGCDAQVINAVLTRIGKKLPDAQRWLIPVFGCQMALDHDPAVPLTGRRLLDVKRAGTRTVTVLDKTYATVMLFSQTGQIIADCAEVRASLEQVLAALPGSVMLDGILTSVEDQPRLALFDIMPLADFRAGLCAQPQWVRHQSLSLLAISGLLRASGGLVEVIAKQEVDLDTAEGMDAFTMFNRDAIEAGCTAIMIKDPEASYQIKKTTAWVKIRPVLQADAAGIIQAF